MCSAVGANLYFVVINEQTFVTVVLRKVTAAEKGAVILSNTRTRL